MAQSTFTLCVLLTVASSVYLAAVGIGAPPPRDPVADRRGPRRICRRPSSRLEAGRGSSTKRFTACCRSSIAISSAMTNGCQSLRGRFEDVFKELERRWQVKMHWLAVNADAMNVDNKPRDDFGKETPCRLWRKASKNLKPARATSIGLRVRFGWLRSAWNATSRTGRAPRTVLRDSSSRCRWHCPMTGLLTFAVAASRSAKPNSTRRPGGLSIGRGGHAAGRRHNLCPAVSSGGVGAARGTRRTLGAGRS